MKEDVAVNGVAVVGMAGRFPRAGDLATLWRHLCAGAECISFYSREELLQAGVPAAQVDHPRYVRAQAMLDDFDLFDASFFGMTSREAEITCPQLRLFLECAWQALEDAGYDPGGFGGTIGVFASASTSSYVFDVLADPEVRARLGTFRVQIANEKEFLPTWVSYKLGLRGPSVNVQTACSSSLVAVHLACQSLLDGECEMALAGGTSVRSLHKSGYLYQEGGILSPDGHCRAFDGRAEGTVSGDGVGVVVLRPLHAAIAAGDNIRAIILGSAVNNDGTAKLGFTAPSLEGQARVVAEALSVASADPRSIGYVEAHGTGTRLGDPIEVAALTEAFRAGTADRGFCALGSVKTNLGHLDAAAGVTGLIKAVLALERRLLPPSLHFSAPNPEIDFASSPFRVNAALAPWGSDGGPRRCGVSSFGIGGTNAHVVLEEAPAEESGPARPWQLLTWSARTAAALARATESLGQKLAAKGVSLPDVAFTLQVGRRSFEHRRALLCADLAEAAHALAGEPSQLLSWAGDLGSRPLTFLFPGQGAQRPGATRDLYAREPAFRAEIDRCSALLRSALDRDLREVLYPAASGGGEPSDDTLWVQPSVFVLDYSLARLWMSWGLRPRAMIGHSLGEYVAACLAGVFRLEEALDIVAFRARLLHELAPGAMLAVALSAEQVVPLLGEELSLAAVNGPLRTVVSGPFDALGELERQLAADGVPVRRLRTSHAFHSSMMDPVLSALEERLSRAALQPPRLPYLSGVTGAWITPEEATSPAFWARQSRAPVRFGACLEALLAEGACAFLEVGPEHPLTGIVRGHPEHRADRHLALATLPSPAHHASEQAGLLEVLGRLWVAGVDVDWRGLSSLERRRRISLPTYPFERRRHLIRAAGTAAAAEAQASPVIASAADEQAEPERLREISVQRTPPLPVARHAAILDVLKDVVHGLTGLASAAIDTEATFLEAGVDSLLLIQASQQLEERLGIKVPMVQLMEELTSLDAVARHVGSQLSEERLAKLFPPPHEPEPMAMEAKAAEVPIAWTGAPTAGAAEQSAVEQLFAQQLQIIAQQLQILQRQGRASFAPAPAVEAPAPPDVPPRALPAAAVPVRYERSGPFHPIEPGPRGGLSEQQREYLEDFVRRYTERTKASKEMTRRFRRSLADGRFSIGFRRLWKELVYPIHGQRSSGALLWDVDGNEYVDINMGFGLHLFGHSPAFVQAAMERQMSLGLELGPQAPLSGEVADLVRELTGLDRVAFCNSGTEAIMGALRIARTCTRRDKVALFEGSYHGWYDGTLVRGKQVGDRRTAVASAPGVSPGTLGDVVALDYDSSRSIELLAEQGRELAAVLVEPVRSRSPEVQPREFLLALREVTERTGALLIFDEMVTGFRVHPGGAQAWFGVRADLATYGKLVASGLPIGVVAGRAQYMDALDGGSWDFGDDSFPQAEKTMFAGAFFKHPLTMAAARAVLARLRDEGAALQETLNARTTRLAAELNGGFAAAGVPAEMVHFGSQFRIRFGREVHHAELFAYHLLHHGVFYTLESGNCFLSPVHSEEDLGRVVAAVRRSIDDLQRGGFLPRAPGRGVPQHAASTEVSELPASNLQRALWIEARMDADANRAYNEPVLLRLNGRLAPGALSAAFAQVVTRHAALRAALVEGGTLWRIAPPSDASIPLTDLSGLPAVSRVAALESWLERQAGEPFDLEAGPLVRCGLARMGERDHCLALTTHHLVVDGQSGGVMIQELSQLYAAACRGEPCALGTSEPFARQLSLARAREASALAAAETYWNGRFATPVPPLALPTDRPRPRVAGHRGIRQRLRLDAALGDAIRGLGLRQRATLFITLLTAYRILLYRLTGQADAVIGVPSRDPSVVGMVVGYFLNLLPLRLEVAGHRGFADCLLGVRRDLVDAQEHRAFPLDRLADRLNPGRDPGRSILPTAFNVDRAAAAPPLLDLEVEVSRPYAGTAKFDLAWNVTEERASLLVEGTHRRPLFERSTMERWLRQFERLLRSIVERPEAPLDLLPILPEPERQQLLVEWRRGPSPANGDGILGRLAARCNDLPEAIAVVGEAGSLTRRQLDLLSSRLAHHLIELGAGAESLVAICLERSPEAILSLLAVWKAGAAYLPLDPGQPYARWALLLDDARPALLVTEEGLAAKLPAGPWRVVCLDRDQAAIARHGDERPSRGTLPENLAYVLYTSGSTGRPKGVMVTHRGLGALAEAQIDLFDVCLSDRILQFAPLSFDASVSEILMALTAGAELHLAAPGAGRTGPDLADLLRRRCISHVTLPPAVLATLPVARLPALRTLVVAGETCPPELVQLWAPGRRVVNAYGPTEATVCVTAAPLEADDRLPIGRPIAGAHALVLGPGMEVLAVGVPGELFAGGVGLARGYLGRPDESAARFVPDPAAELPGERLYATGDRARWLPDGRLEYLGRLDFQVKVRGIRVELEEVEAALRALPGVREAVVAVRGDGAGRTLAAYVALDSVEAPATLQEALSRRLPDALVPTAWTVLPALPRLASGKVDRRSLPAPEGEVRVAEHAPPRSELERFLTDLWCEILGIERIGIHDNFFQLGGSSITGALLVNRLQATLAEVVHVVAMFEAPTVAQLAAYLEEHYPAAVDRLWGTTAERPEQYGAGAQAAAPRIDAVRVAELRRLIAPPAQVALSEATNPTAAFILSPPRSGSTLLRVLLGGNPRLFAPPELELLSFATLGERRRAFTGRNAFWLEGAVRAVMEARGCGVAEAERFIAEREAQGASTQALYRHLQEAIGGRILVDKTPAYALDLAVLRRAEAIFDRPRYVHLLRHPGGMIHSFDRARLDQVFFRHPHPFTRRELAELIWVASHQNILEFLATVPEGRRAVVHFERLVREPEAVLREVCDFLEVEFDPGMLAPYEEGSSSRMTDGIHPWSRMLGDVTFHQRSAIDAGTAERWREELAEASLGEVTRELAAALGYAPASAEARESWTPIAPAMRRPDEAVPLSFAQQRLWFIHQMSRDSSAYSIPIALRLGGALDRRVLGAALTEIVGRHGSLRTTFGLSQQLPVQRIAPPAPYHPLLVDLDGLPSELREAELHRLVAEEARRPFDLERGPLLRTTLLRLDEQQHAALLTLHHIVSDGWSVGVLVRELTNVYSAFAMGRASSLAPLPIQYADFALWQRRYLTGEVLERQLAHWRQCLAGAPRRLDLPTDRPRPPRQRFRGGSRSFEIAGSVTGCLHELGGRQGASLFMTLLAAYGVLLARSAGEDDVLIGTPIANRNRPETEGLIGLFVNTLVLRVDLSGAPSFSALLARVREFTLAAYAHQDTPFEALVEDLQPERSLSHTPLFQVMLVLQNAPSPLLELPGLAIGRLGAEIDTAKFDLTLNVVEHARGLGARWGYNRDLFDVPTVARLTDRLDVLLTAIAATPHLPISELPLLGSAELEELAHGGGELAPTAPWMPVHRLFERQAERTPDALAVAFEDEALTYAALDARANGLALRLRNLGVGPESRVGVLAGRSLKLAIAVLGIWKAGGAYLPFEPTLPQARLALMADDALGSGPLAPVLVAEAALRDLLAAFSPHARVVWLEGIEPAGDRPLASAGEGPAPAGGGFDVAVWPSSLAYLIYTSGTTGRPKAVTVEHRSLCQTLLAAQRVFEIGAADRMLCLAPFSFDIFLFELLAPLLAGGAAVLVRLQPAPDLRALISLLDAATLFHAVPAVMRQVVEAARRRGVRPLLRRVFVGGDAVPPDLRESLREVFPRAVICVLYGPTEGTIFVSCEDTDKGPRRDVHNPIGRSLPGAVIKVRDRSGRLAPIGAPGELWIGGSGVARGYFGEPALTAERFVPAEAGRSYRTGDLARRLPDGRFAYLGRIDRQVKVRGFRIEPGEVEDVLRAYPTVKEVAVVGVADAMGERRLVAWVVPAAEAEMQGEVLAAFASERLAEPMVPTSWRRLESLPLTPHGKVDRQALARLAASPEDDRKGCGEEPRTPLERLLVDLWIEVLGRTDIGVRDDFFASGGNSIKVAVLTNLLGERLGEHVWVVALFEAPTVERLARYLTRHYAAAVRRIVGDESGGEDAAPPAEPIDGLLLSRFRAKIPPLALSGGAGRRNPRAVFILSPPRSGSTLLRVLLAGHPALFAPPELELLGFDTLRERRAAFSGRYEMWSEGTLRALMEVHSCDLEDARRAMAEREAAGVSTRELYRELQSAIGGRLLVDKTPSYALDIAVLRRAEREFEEPFFIHLVRHPCGTISSFVQARLEEVFFRYDHAFTSRQLAELIWVVSHQNILELLAEVPAKRQAQIRFEDLVERPAEVIGDLCQRLGIDFHLTMLDPYDQSPQRMTDGVHALSRMVGDLKFHQHSAIAPEVAGQWRKRMTAEDLGEVARELAAALGEEVEPIPWHRAHEAIIPSPRTFGARLPLSFAQQRLWFLQQLVPATSTYNLATALGLWGQLSLAAFSAAWNGVVRRHESLRTTFVVVDGEPAQVIGPAVPVPLPVVDLQAVPEGARRQEARERVRAEARRPFDLTRGPLLRVHLLALGDDEHAVVVVMHHIITDGWSMGILLHELGALYSAALDRLAPALPSLPVQYGDFALWQRRRLSGGTIEPEIEFWRQQLAGVQPLELPTDRPRPALPTMRGALVPCELSSRDSAALQESARDHGATLFMMLLAGLQALLARHARQDDIALGTSVAGRGHRQVEGLIGFFVNTLVLRADLTDAETSAALVARARQTALAAFAHQDVPFERLVEELRPERDPARTPFFQVMLVLQGGAVEGRAEAFPGLRLSPLPAEIGRATFDLTLSFSLREGRLSGALNYATDLFDATTVGRLAEHLRTLLSALGGERGRPWRGLPLLTAAEEQQLVEWNDTRISERAPTFLARIGARAREAPDTLAIHAGDAGLTYGRLAERANQLARHLRWRGVGPDVRVGLCLERGIEAAVAILGVLQAGGAYVPLDPSYPVDRLRRIVEDGVGGATLPVVVTREGLAGRRGPLAEVLPAQAEVVLVDRDRAAIAGESGEPLPGPEAPADALAYVIFTSGSTGHPKGVAVPRRGLASLCETMAALLGIGPGSRVLHFLPLSFDASVQEIAVTLAAGATIWVADDRERLPGPDLVRFIAASGVTVAALSPSMLALLPEVDLPELSTLVVAAEICPLELARRWARGRRLVNVYGPTEATVCASAAVFDASGRLPIGLPIAGTEVHLLGDGAAPSPVGTWGELAIAGCGLARGYLGRPDLTAAAFRPAARGGEPGARWYCTGDRARRLPDGRVEFLGRLDDQVKVRGIRVEPAEIEAALASVEGVRDVAVMARTAGGGIGRELWAYVVPSADVALTASDLRNVILSRVPEPLVPSFFVFLESLPLGPNGKLDRRALASMTAVAAPAGRSAPVAPRNPLESALVEVWEALLPVRPIGVRDSYFDLGGHSLLSVRLMAQIEKRLGVRLPLATLFEAPTIEQLARRIAIGGHRSSSPLVALQPAGRRPPFFCVHPIGGGVVGYRHLARHLGAEQPFYALQARGLDEGPVASETSVEEMAATYLEAILEVQPRGPFHLGGLSFGGLVAFEIAQRLSRRGERVSLLALLDTSVPLVGGEVSPADTGRLALALVREQSRQEGKSLALSAEELIGLGIEEQLERILEQMRAIDLVGPEVDVAALRRFIAAYESRRSAALSYRARPYAGEICLFRPLEVDPEHLRHASAARHRQFEEPTLGWGELALRGVRVYRVPGYHETMIMEPNVRVLSEVLATCIADDETAASAA